VFLTGTDRAQWSINGGCTNFAENCNKEITGNYSIKSIKSWQRIFKGNFKHGDRYGNNIKASIF
jgi:hypothetical protein